MICGMKIKTSITLDSETLRALDEVALPGENRSRFIETAVRALVEQRRRHARDARDRALIDRHCVELAAFMDDVLSYQVEP